MGRIDKRRYERNCTFSNKKRKRAAWIKREDKTMTLDTEVNLAEKTKAPFIIRNNGG